MTSRDRINLIEKEELVKSKPVKTFFGGINSNIKFLVLTVLSSMLFFPIFSLDSKKNSHTKQL